MNPRKNMHIYILILGLAALVIVLILLSGVFPAPTLDGSVEGFNKTLIRIIGPIDNFQKFLFSLLRIIVTLILFILIFGLFRWLLSDKDVVIQPFIVGCCDKSYDGNAISDLLYAELSRIRNINMTAGARKSEENNRRDPGAKKKELALPNFVPSSESLDFNVSSVTISGGPVTLSVGQMLLLLRRIAGHPISTITGSIQKYGSTISLVARMGGLKVAAWEVKKRDNASQASSGKDDNNISETTSEEILSDMLRDLAFKIAMDISDPKELEAKNWRGLKYFTEALEEYNQFKINGGVQRVQMLESSRKLCLEAVKAEINYKEQPSNLLSNLGNEYISLRRYSEAEQLFRDAIDIKQEPDSLLGLGVALHNQNRLEDALQAYDRAIELNSTYAKAWFNKGYVLDHLQKYDESLECFEKATTIDPQYKDAWIGKGHDLGKHLGKPNEAIKAFDEAIKIDPTYAYAWYNKGDFLSSKGDFLSVYDKYNEAIKAYDEAIRLDPNYAEAWNDKGVALNALGRKAEADAAFAKAKELGYKG